MAQTQYADIQLKDEIPESVRTEGKDDAARIIQDKIDNGSWPVPLTELAEKTDWSRAHYQNTIRDYFEPGDGEENETHVNTMHITVPKDVDRESYLRGWINGYLEDR